MYTYYMVASMGPQYQKYLWWKKYLTMMQMIQFCIVFLHSAQVLFRQCDYPKTIAFLLAFQAVFFFYLFAQFFVKAYMSKEKVKTTANGVHHKEVQVNGVETNGIELNGLLKTKLKTNSTILNGKTNGTVNYIANGKIKDN
nr:elongation of very long chain fatty acids protein AAEL008004-like [Onthophagus taurus]